MIFHNSNHRNNHEFDDFNYYKVISENSDFNLDPDQFKGDSFPLHPTEPFYWYYINQFGYEFIEDEISKLTDGDLASDLRNIVFFCKKYEKYQQSDFEDFCEQLLLPESFEEEYSSVKPIITTDNVYDFSVQHIYSEKFNDLVAPLLAYLVDSESEDRIERIWFYFKSNFYALLGPEKGEKQIESLFAKCNQLLSQVGSDAKIAEQNKTKIVPIDYGEDYKSFARLCNQRIVSEEMSRYEQIHIGNQVFYKHYMQIFPLYSRLREIHGANYFHNEADFVPGISKQHPLFIYDTVFNRNYKSECLRFKDFLSMLGLDFLYDCLSSYVPVSYYSIDTFIQKNLTQIHWISLNTYVAILLVYWLYDKEDQSYSTREYVSQFLLESLGITYFSTEQRRENVNHIISLANRFSNKFNLPLIPCTFDNRFVMSGTFVLPWSYVTFGDDYIVPHHPLYNKHHIDRTFEFWGAKKSYNDIKRYFINVVPPLTVRSEYSIIVDIDRKKLLSLEKYVYPILERVTRAHSKVEIIHKLSETRKVKTHLRTYVESMDAVPKSYYLDKLCSYQLPTHKVFFLKENRNTSSGSNIENVFGFVVNEDEKYIMLVLENTLESRATLVFKILKSGFNCALDTICDFFLSDFLNKRQMLQYNNVNFNCPSIVYYRRIIHDSQSNWRYKITLYVDDSSSSLSR